MDLERLARLTERERSYLRLVFNAMSSKEIARQFGIEPGTVDKALKTAMAKLGTSSRRAAARMLAEFEAGQKLAPQSEPIALDHEQNIIGRSSADKDCPLVSGSREAVREEQAPYGAMAPRWKGIRLPFPRYEGDRNDLTIGKRLMWIGVASLSIIVAVGTLITIATGAGRAVASIIQLLS